MNPAVYDVIRFLLCVILAQGIFVAITSNVARRCGVTVLKAVLGTGPRIFQRGVFILKLLPIAAHVRMYDPREGIDPELDLRTSWPAQPRLVRIIILLAPWLVLFVVVIGLRGLDGWHSFMHAFPQIFSVLLDPGGAGVELMRRFGRVAEQSPLHVLFAIVAAKIVAYNLLPIPLLAGWAMLREALVAPDMDPRESRFDRVAQQVGLVIVLAFMVTWAWAVWHAFA